MSGAERGQEGDQHPAARDGARARARAGARTARRTALPAPAKRWPGLAALAGGYKSRLPSAPCAQAAPCAREGALQAAARRPSLCQSLQRRHPRHSVFHVAPSAYSPTSDLYRS